MKVGLFFGAGAELGYGLPSGGKFAIDLFREDIGPHKTSLRSDLGQINPLSAYATKWLPEKFATQRLHAFSKGDFNGIIESSIEYRKSDIIKRLNEFDKEADKAMESLGIARQNLVEKYNEEMAHEYGEHLFSAAVRINPILANKVELFGSEFYSALLSTLSANRNLPDIRRYSGAFLQLLVGAHGQELVQKLNQELFESAPDDIPIFDEVSGMFRIEFSRAGLGALELLMEDRREMDLSNASLPQLLAAISQKIIENIFTSVLDYQSLIDSHFRYLFSPKTEWAKFTKMVLFLRSTRAYIVSSASNLDINSKDGYYHDLEKLSGLGIEIAAVGTSNYNSIFEDISRTLNIAAPEARHLNGSIHDFYDPYKNSITTIEDPEDLPRERILVPFILTQSGLKPLTSVEMSRRYVALYDDYTECDKIVVVGYAFNGDDSHINGLFRSLIEDRGKELHWICSDQNGSSEQQLRELSEKLRLDTRSRESIFAHPVDPNTRSNADGLWIDSLK